MSRPNAKDADIRSSEHGTTILLILFGMVLGLVTVLGGEKRWSAPAFEAALSVPGAPESWGWVLLAASAATLYGYWNSRGIGLYLLTFGMFLMGLWFLFFGIAFLVQFIDNNTVSANGPLISTLLAILYIQRSVMYWRGAHA